MGKVIQRVRKRQHALREKMAHETEEVMYEKLMGAIKNLSPDEPPYIRARYDFVGPPRPGPYDTKAKPIDESVLSWLERRQVMTIQRAGTGFELVEECDRYYSAPLTRAELLQLAAEIRALAETA